MNKEVKVILNTIERVKQFVQITEKFKSEIDVLSGRYVISGKSIMGIFSLNLLEPLVVKIFSDDIEEIESFNRVMEEFKYECNS